LNSGAWSYSQSSLDDDQKLVESLLVRNSRTFALTIPLLPENLRRQVGVAYLLFRIADTIEDGVRIDQLRKRKLFAVLSDSLTDPGPGDAAFVDLCREHPPHHDDACGELLESLPRVLSVVRHDPVPCELICERVRESIEAMQRFTSAGGRMGNVRLKSMVELRKYCYSVAGIVGELLTQLFLVDNPGLDKIRDELFRRASVFGEGLQLVNILKDSDDDMKEGRLFVPVGIPRQLLFELAREDLVAAQEYIELLSTHGASPGVIRFNQLPVSLARETLKCVESAGPGSKVSRERVDEIVNQVLSDSN
jgi:farnesyl-diphosphate farnesyltransferase